MVQNLKCLGFLAVMMGGLMAEDVSRLYWTDKNTGLLEASDLDGGNRVTIVSGQSDPRGIVIDDLLGQLYWVTRGTGEIRNADLDGGNQATFLSGLNDPADLAWDEVGRTLYWADEDGGRIWRKSIDGDELPSIVIKDLSRPYYLAVDAENGFVYWSEFGNTVIRRCSLEGMNQEIVISGQVQVRDIEVADGVIYWCDRESSDVRSRALDGVGSGTVLFSGGGMDRPHGLVLDPPNNRLYWTDTRAARVSSGAMDGSGSEDILVSTGLIGAWAIDLWHAPVDPYEEWQGEHFTSEELNNAGLEDSVWGAHADPDGDGRDNLLEYAQGTDPRAASVDVIEVFLEGGEMQVKFRLRRNDPSLQFEMESTFDLSAAVWDADEMSDELVRTPDPSDSRFEYIQVESDSITEQTPKLFARLRVSR